jgi:hypothetical protein
MLGKLDERGESAGYMESDEKVLNQGSSRKNAAGAHTKEMLRRFGGYVL